MYAALLSLHSLLRWVVLGAAVFALARAAGGLRAGRPWDTTDKRAGLILTIAADTQLLLGLLLQFVLSPLTTGLLSNMGAAMKDRVSRFWAVEHVTGMLVGLVLLHVGSIRTKRADPDASKHKQALLFYGLALVVILASVPWPFLGHGRPWLRVP